MATADRSPTPRWYLPVAVAALLWNALGCAAYLMDVTLSPEDVAAMSEAQQALYASRSAWMVAATAVAVWAGLAGSAGLVLRRRWATALLWASLAGVVVQDIGLFVVSGAASGAGAAVVILQGLVLAIAVALVALGRKASERGWLA